MKPVYFLIAIALVTIFFMIELFNPFLKPMFVALLLTIATSSPTSYLQKKLKFRVVASFIMTITLASLFFLPILYCISSFATFFNEVDQSQLVQSLNSMKDWIINTSKDFTYTKDFMEQITSKIDIGKTVENLISLGAFLGKNSAKFMINMVFTLVFFFFFTQYSSSIATFIRELLPIKKDDSITLFYESSNVMTVVLYSILITAIFEGVLFGFFVSFFNYDGLLLGVLYGFASLIPVIGGLIIWLPVSIYEASIHGSMTNAIVIVSYSIVVISIIADTFIKPIIIKYINQKMVKTPTKVNELLIFFSILAGLSTIGFWGAIIGPAIVTFFISIMHLLKKYSEDFKENTSL